YPSQSFVIFLTYSRAFSTPLSVSNMIWITRGGVSSRTGRSGDSAAMSVFKDAGHLFRFAGLFVLAFIIFLVVRHYVVPPSFGQYGHYRGAAIGEIAQRPVKFAGHQTCETCHTDVLD